MNSSYRDWVKAGLATKYLKEGIEVFIDNVCKRQHEDMLLDINKQYGIVPTGCNSCNLKTLMPIHSKDRNGCPLSQKPVCNCLNVHGKTLCPTKFCSAMYDKIVTQHMFNAPNWNNTEIAQWGRNHWEIAKCNIPGRGYRSKISARETDCAGLLNIAINNMNVHCMLNCVIDPPNDLLLKTRAARDDIFHSPDMELDHIKMETYIKDMIAILNDKKHLCTGSEAIAAAEKLQKLLNDDFRITAMDEVQVRKEALAAIEEKKQLAISAVENEGERQKKLVVEEMEEKKEHVLQVLRTEQRKSSGSTTEKLENIEKNYQEMDKKFSHFKEDISLLQCKMESESKSRADKSSETKYKELKNSLQTGLIALYQEHLTKTYVLPMMQEDECDVKDIYVDPYMFIGEEQKTKKPPVIAESVSDPLFRFKIEAKSSEPSSDLEKDVTTYRPIFYHGEKKNRKIYLSGGAGMGKTTFCKNLISRWCDAHAKKSNASTKDDDDDIDDDTKILQSFQLVFFVTLRQIKNERHVHDMIKTQLLTDEQDKTIFEQILTLECEDCLIILDGLDEWNTDEEPPHSPFQNSLIPQINIKKTYTILTTTRPWKLEEVRLRDSDKHIHVTLQGLSSSSSDIFIQKVVETLNKKFKRSKQHWQFRAELKRQSIADLKSVPIVLLQLICIWHDGKPFGTSLCDIYSRMIDLHFAMSKKPVSNTHQGNQQLPKCFDNKRKCRENSELLLKLSKLAFETLFPLDGKSALEFDRSEEDVFGMSSKEIDICLQLGLLTVSKVVGKSASVRLARLSFLHETFQEFMAAVFIADVEESASNLRQSQVHEVLAGDCSAIAERIFISCSTLLGVLEMGRIFKFVAGMNPTLGKQLSMGIHNIVGKIDTVQQYRIGEENDKYPSDLKQVQSLIFACISEMQNAHPECGKMETSLYLDDVIIDEVVTNVYFDDFAIDEPDEYLSGFIRKDADIKSTMSDQLPYLDMSGIRSVFITQSTPDCIADGALESISTCQSLEKLVVWIRSSSNALRSNNITNRVFQIMGQSCHSLISVSLCCRTSNHVGYIVNIPSVLSNLSYVCFEGLVSHHTNCEEIISLLQNSINLKQLRLRDMKCQDHEECSLVVEFPAIHQLQKLDLRRAWNIGLTDNNLKLNIDMRKLEYVVFNDTQMTENALLAFLNDISGIEQTLEVVLSNIELRCDSIRLKEVKICNLRVMKPHESAKSSQTKTFIDIEHDITTAKEIHFLYGHVIANSKLIPKLKCLDIRYRLEKHGLCSDIAIAIVKEVPKLLHLERLALRNIDLGDAEFMLSARMENLSYMELDSCTITGRAFKAFLCGVPKQKQILKIEVNQTQIVEKRVDDTIPLTPDDWNLTTLKVIAQWFGNGENIEIESILTS